MGNAQREKPFDNPFWIVFLAAFCVVFIWLANRLGHVGIADQIIFLLSQIAFTLIPGMALMLLIGPPGDRVRFAALSYLLGICVVVAEYFVFYAAGLQDHLLACMCGVTALSVFCVWKKRSALKRVERDNRGAWAFSFLLAALLIAVLFQAVSIYNTPDVDGRPLTAIYQDLTWNIGNTTSLERGMPVTDIHVAGLTFGYHYLSAGFLAVFKNILGLSSFTLYIKLMPVVQVFAFAGGLYALYALLFKNRWLVLAASGVTALCCLTTMQHMLWYAFASPIGMGLALAATGYFLRYIKKMETAKLRDRDFLLFLIFLAVTIGTKAPFGAGVLAGSCILLLVQLIRRVNVKTTLLAGALVVAVFGAVYLGLVHGTHTFNGFRQAFAAELFAYPPGYYTDAMAALPSLSPGVVRLMVYPVYMAERYTALFAAALLLIAVLFRPKDRDRKQAIFLLAGILVCAGAASVLYQPGMSQLFFMEAAVPLSVFTLFWLCADMVRSNAKKAAKIVFICAVAAIFSYSAIYTLYLSPASLTLLSGNEHTRGADAYNSISDEEYEGMVWLKSNTAEDAVFAVDRQHYSPQEDVYYARYYYYTAFSERACYLEGYNYISAREEDYQEIIFGRLSVIQKLYNENDGASAEKIIADGVDYLVVTRSLHPEFRLDEAFGGVVFENPGMTIYELKAR